MSLSTENLGIGYHSGRERKVLASGVDLELVPGRLTALLGPNGSGKSTLIRTLAGLHPPLVGKVNLENKPISGWAVKDLAYQLAVVLQDPVRSANLTVFELVAMGRIPYTNWTGRLKISDQKEVIGSLKRVGIEKLAARSIQEISDGEWQKTMFARSLAQNTPIILLDEPTAHLDLLSKIELIQILRSAAHEGNKAILFSTHDLELALQMTDMIWLMGDEKYIRKGIPEDLVLEGHITRLYSGADGSGFDLADGLVKFRPVVTKKPIQLNGSGIAWLWTKKALERRGYSCDPVSGEADTVVSIETGPKGPVWEIISPEATRIAKNIAEVIEVLK